MPYAFNPFTGNFDYWNDSFRGIFPAAPANPQEGWFYINSSNNGYYVFYSGQWQLIATLTPAALNYLLLETADHILLETGDKLALEA